MARAGKYLRLVQQAFAAVEVVTQTLDAGELSAPPPARRRPTSPPQLDANLDSVAPRSSKSRRGRRRSRHVPSLRSHSGFNRRLTSQSTTAGRTSSCTRWEPGRFLRPGYLALWGTASEVVPGSRLRRLPAALAAAGSGRRRRPFLPEQDANELGEIARRYAAHRLNPVQFLSSPNATAPAPAPTTSPAQSHLPSTCSVFMSSPLRRSQRLLRRRGTESPAPG